MAKPSLFSRYSMVVLLYTLCVVAWGALVRATGSGAGCGSHWPTCDGEVLPNLRNMHIAVEFVHRATSGITVGLIALLVTWAFYTYPRASPVRFGSLFCLGFTLSEALIGAWLVHYQLVAQDQSVARVVVISAHLVNTFMLLASLTLTWYWSTGGSRVRLRGQGAVGWALALSLAGITLLGVSGAVTALGDTLYPVATFSQGLRQDFSPQAQFILRLRPAHPLAAVSVALFTILVCGLAAHLRPSARTTAYARWVSILIGAQICLGAINALALAPIPLQLAHLLLAEAVWAAMVMLAAAALAVEVRHVELAPARPASEAGGRADGPGRAGFRDYVALTKPRVISLLLFTTLSAMVIAHGGWPGTWLFLTVAVAGYLSAGSANTINMVIDTDIDYLMKRTASRPTVTHKVPPRRALVFGLVLGLLSFGLFWKGANLLSAVLALAGLVFYVIVYTLMLKRRTWQNIVIGGAAGAFPPLVGWAAATNQLAPLAWLLFAIIFVWTPVHFWALALLIKDDYRSAGVPMLPVVHGERVTVIQIGLYTILTVIISMLPLVQRQTGWLYLLVAAALNLLLVVYSVRLYNHPEKPQAKALFKYSMVYLFALFLVMAVDRTLRA